MPPLSICLASGRELVLDVEPSQYVRKVISKLEAQLEVDRWHEVRLLQGTQELPNSSPLLLLDETQQLQAIISESPSKTIAVLKRAQYEDSALWEEALRRVTQLGSRAAPWTHVIEGQINSRPGQGERDLLVAAKSAVWMDPMSCFRQLVLHAAQNGDNASVAQILHEHKEIILQDFQMHSPQQIIISSTEQADFKQPSVDNLRRLLFVLKLSILDDSFMHSSTAALKTTYESVFVPMMDIPEFRNLWKQSFHESFFPDALAYSKKQNYLTKLNEVQTPAPLLLSISVLGKIGVAEAGPWLEECLLDADPIVRSAAARALGRLEDSLHVQGLERACQEDSEASVRGIAARSLESLRKQQQQQSDVPSSSSTATS
ncbi:unnamed protein product [Polarella glacialis]|uniref:Uncharacterized protein n=1 Tax=Polarella glacialis TaxID=89957 RepID=A0A813EPJ1_POLGL|nr:unnamed protein product [Polarella glacialis]